MRTGFKIVIRCPSDRYSLISCGSCLYYVKYIVGEYIKRPDQWGPLSVFSNWYFANQFLAYNTLLDKGALVYECEYMPSVDDTLWVITREGSKCVKMTMPAGTRFADSVMLIREAS